MLVTEEALRLFKRSPETIEKYRIQFAMLLWLNRYPYLAPSRRARITTIAKIVSLTAVISGKRSKIRIIILSLIAIPSYRILPDTL